jgi:hypothetical protein
MYQKAAPKYFEEFWLRNGGRVPKLMWLGSAIDVGGEYHQCLIIWELVPHFSTEISQNI